MNIYKRIRILKKKRKKLIREAYKYMNDEIFEAFRTKMIKKVSEKNIDFAIGMARTFGTKVNGKIVKFVDS